VNKAKKSIEYINIETRTLLL